MQGNLKFFTWDILSQLQNIIFNSSSDSNEYVIGYYTKSFFNKVNVIKNIYLGNKQQVKLIVGD